MKIQIDNTVYEAEELPITEEDKSFHVDARYSLTIKEEGKGILVRYEDRLNYILNFNNIARLIKAEKVIMI